MKISELKVLEVAPDNYQPDPNTPPATIASCIDARIDGKKKIPTLAEVVLNHEWLKKNKVDSIIGKILTVQLDRLPMVPFPNAALKIVGEIVEIK